MSALANINIAFTSNLKQFSTEMQSAVRQLKSVGKNLQNVGKQLSVGVTAPFAAFAAVSLKNWDKQEKAIAQVEAGLKSVGDGVGYTSSELQKMASEMQNNSLFGDEDILQNATAQLLTFTNIASTQFKRTQQAALDLATRLGGDLKSASIQLGKALNDPKANLSALSRSGIQFSQDQKAMINSLVETNRLADAQTIILNELEKQYGGSAEAAAKAGLGPFKQLSNIIGDLTEDFGKIIGQALLPFIAKLKEMFQGFQKLSPETKRFIVVVGSIAAAVGPVLVALGYLMTNVIPGLITVFGGLKAAVAATSVAFKSLTVWIASNPFGALLIALGAVVAYFVLFRKETEKVVKTQSVLTQINNEATKSIAAEKAKLVELVSIAKDERINKNQRIRAIKELNKLSPKYLGDLNLETINTDKARKALEKYNEELLKVAKVKAAQAKLQEIQSKIIDLELKQAKNLVDGEKNRASEVAKITANDQINLAQKEKLLKVLGQGNAISEIANNQLLDKIALLREEEKLVLDIIKANNINTSSGSVTPEPKTGKRKKAETLLDGAEKQKASLDGLVKGIQDKREKLNTELKGIQTDFIDFSTQMSDIITNGVTSFLSGIGEMIGGLILGAVSMADVGGMMLKVVGDLVTQLGEAAVQVGVGMLAIQSAFSNPFGAIAAGIALIAIGSVISGIASQFSGGQEGGGVTPFANGGIVYGPTNALIGEYAGASSNPEVVAPLSKLKELITPASQNLQIALAGELTADAGKLKAVLTKYDVRKSRTS